MIKSMVKKIQIEEKKDDLFFNQKFDGHYETNCFMFYIYLFQLYIIVMSLK